MPAPLTAVLAMRPTLLDELFPPDVQGRLRRVAEFPDPPSVRLDLADAAGQGMLAETELLLTGWGCPLITAEILDAAPRLRAIVHAAGSVKGHVSPEVFTRGITVSSAASANAVPVADYTMAMLVLAAKRSFGFAQSYREGDYFGPETVGEPVSRDIGLVGATVGVVGASRVGRLVIERLRAFGCSVLLADPYVKRVEVQDLGAWQVDVDDLCRQADLVTLHAPELSETRHLIDDRRLSLLRDGTTVVNTARGSLVDTDALARHCATGRVTAVLDVTEPEPLPAGHPLFSLPNVVLTPHVAGARGRELHLLGDFAVGEVERLAAGLTPRGIVRGADFERIA